MCQYLPLITGVIFRNKSTAPLDQLYARNTRSSQSYIGFLTFHINSGMALLN